MRIKSIRGFTILEILLAVAIFSVLSIVIYVVLDSGMNIWMVTDASASNQLEARRAMMDMERQIRGGTGFSFIPVGNPPYNSIQFTLDSETITYSLQYDSPTSSYYIQRTSTVNPARRLGYNIKTLEFTPLPNIANLKQVVVSIELEKTIKNGRKVGFSLAQALNVRN